MSQVAASESSTANEPRRLLVVEGDADSLRQDGIASVVDALERALEPLVQRNQLKVTRFRMRSASDIGLARTFAPLFRADAVLLVGHGSAARFAAAPGLSLSWTEVATLIAPLQPRAMLAMSCYAARSSAALALFRGIPTLGSLFGALTPLTAPQAQLAALELLAETLGLDVSPEVSALVSVANAYATGGVVVRRRRELFLATNPVDLIVEDHLAALAQVLLRSRAPERQPRRRRPPNLRSPHRAVFRSRTRFAARIRSSNAVSVDETSAPFSAVNVTVFPATTSS